MRTTWAAYAKPAPNAMKSAVSPLFAWPVRRSWSSASGIEAAEVLPCSAMSRAMTTCSGSLRERAIASTIRMFAWCGTKRSRSSTVIPVRSRVSWATFAISNAAQRKTALPCITRCGIRGCSEATTSRQSSRWRIRSNCSPSEPHTTGAMPGSSLGPTTTAPAPSAKMNAVPRSWGSVRSESRSTPITRTYLALPPRIMSEASATACEKPAQAALMSKATGRWSPSSWATAVATAGSWSRWEIVATITPSTWALSIPAFSMAMREAATDIICTVSSGSANRRLLMPERCWIHSSEESIASTISEFGTSRRGR